MSVQMLGELSTRKSASFPLVPVQYVGRQTMKSSFLTAAAVLIALSSHGCMTGSGANLITQQAPAAQAKPKKSMLAFRSEQELNRYLRELVEKQKRKRRRVMAKLASPAVVSNGVAGLADADKESESVTNIQHAG